MKDNLEEMNTNIEEKKVTNNNEILSEKENEDPKDTKEEIKKVENDIQNEPKKKNNLKIVIIIGIVTLVLILCLGGGYFAYLKFFKNSIGKLTNEIKNNNVNTVKISKEEADALAALEKTLEKPIVEALQKEEKEPTTEKEDYDQNEDDPEIINDNDNIDTTEIPKEETDTLATLEKTHEKPIIEDFQEEEEEEPIIEDENIDEDEYDLRILETVYHEVIDKGNEDYLYNFTPRELAIIRNTLYARRGYKFKKKIYQNYFGEKSWYTPTTSNQNILTRDEERLANIIKRYE